LGVGDDFEVDQKDEASFMSTFGLVHGGALGAWCWDRTIPELMTRGHSTATVDLPLEDQSAGAAQLAALVLEAFAECDDLVLVGHSMSGLIIPVVACQRPVKRLIFLHAVLPQPGLSFVDQVKAEPDMFNSEMMTVPPTWWTDEAIVTRFLFHDCTPEIANEAFVRLRPPEGGVLVTEVTPLRNWPVVPCAYILCRDDRTATPAWARCAARERLGIEPTQIPGGHCPMLSRPSQLAQALAECL
jgi:pimeloyl-ACP methyl ester carboxylesterase